MKSVGKVRVPSNSITIKALQAVNDKANSENRVRGKRKI